MTRRTVIAGVAALVFTGAPTAHAAAPKTSAIKSPSLSTCLDPSVSPNPYDTLAGAPCLGSAAQSFSFIPIVGGREHTYEIQDRASGQCVVLYRFGIEQGACPASPSSDAAWTLQRTGASSSRYRIVETSTLNDQSPRCWNVSPQVSGQPGPLFGLHDACSTLAHRNFDLAAGL